MKSLIWYFLAFSGMLLFLSSCEEDDPDYFSDYQILDAIHEKYDIVGETHNQGLDYVFSKINGFCLDTLSVSELEDLIKSETENFLDSILSMTSSQNDSLFVVIDKTVDDFSAYFSESDASTIINHVATTYSFTSIQEEYLRIIDTIFTDPSSDLESTIDRLEDLYLEAHNDSRANSSDRAIIYSAISVAQHSARYWDENLDDWLVLSCNVASRGWFSWKQVGKNDIAYGAAGGVAGAIVGGSVSFGALTIPGWAAGAIGGAVGGSVGNAVLQVLDHVWPE